MTISAPTPMDTRAGSVVTSHVAVLAAPAASVVTIVYAHRRCGLVPAVAVSAGWVAVGRGSVGVWTATSQPLSSSTNMRGESSPGCLLPPFLDVSGQATISTSSRQANPAIVFQPLLSASLGCSSARVDILTGRFSVRRATHATSLSVIDGVCMFRQPVGLSVRNCSRPAESASVPVPDGCGLLGCLGSGSFLVCGMFVDVVVDGCGDMPVFRAVGFRCRGIVLCRV